MKKLLYSLLAVGTVAGLASCSSDEPMMSGNSDGKVSIEVKLPDFGTRFYGDQLQCNELIYTIFTADGDAIDGVTDVKQDAFGPGVTSETVTLNLVPGETYMIAFYAHNKGSLFSAYSNGTIDVNYEKMNVNNEIDDAFYCYVPISTTATEPQSVTLNRAFAQINFGTNDFDNALVNNVIGNLEATLTINGGLSTSLDAKTDAVSVPQTEAVTVSNTLTSNEDFPVSGYGNLTSVYVLVGGEEGEMLSTGSYVVTNAGKEVRNVNLASTPVRMNYRTNIYGAMLTTQIPVTVEIEPNFTDEYGRVVIDGVSYKNVSTPEEFTESLTSGEPVYVAKGTTLDLSDWNPTPEKNEDYVLITDPLSWRIDGALTNFNTKLQIESVSANIEGNGNITFGEPKESGYSAMINFTGNALNKKATLKGLTITAVEGNDCDLVAFDASRSNVEIDNVTIQTQSEEATPLTINYISNVTLSNSTLKANYTALNLLKGDNGGTINIENCVIESAWAPIEISGGSSSESNFNVNNCVIVQTSPEFDSGLGLDVTKKQLNCITTMGSGIWNISNSYLYSNGGYATILAIITSSQCEINLTDCRMNKPVGYRGSNLMKDPVTTVTAPYTLTTINESKTVGGVNYTFTTMYNGKYTVPNN